jgi:Arc/MetJ-type ribon-helix-helix transcriptional regulator
MRRDDPLEKTGYRIPRSVVAMVREAVDAGSARSQNEFVERALRRELGALERARLHEAYGQASADPAFMADMSDTAAAWGVTENDGLPGEED